MILAQVTDTHIRLPGRLAYGRVDTAAALARAVAALNVLHPQPDRVLLTGDLVDFGRADEYAHLKSILSLLRAPYLLLPGNHDERGQLRAAFPEHEYLGTEGFIQYAMALGPLRLVALDTVIPMRGDGELCEWRLAWLDETLAAEPGMPTLVMMHHPPFATGIGHMDKIGLAGSERFAEVIARHPQVERIICGHLHRPIQCRVANTVASTCPAPCHQVALDLRVDAPSAFVLEPPGYQLHHWIEGTGLVTHTAVLGDYEGPYPFYDKDGRLID
jgi:3',5'-cyclic AMP phosphodiesterase CpdA